MAHRKAHRAGDKAFFPGLVVQGLRDGRVGAEGRRGEEYAVVGRDGSVQLPPDVLEMLPPGTLLHVRRHAVGVDLRNPELEHHDR